MILYKKQVNPDRIKKKIEGTKKAEAKIELQKGGDINIWSKDRFIEIECSEEMFLRSRNGDIKLCAQKGNIKAMSNITHRFFKRIG